MSSLGDKHAANGQKAKAVGPQLVANTKKRVGPSSQATGMNRHIKAAVIRLVVDSPMEFRDFGYIAKYAGTREDKAIAVVRDYIRDLRAQVPTPPRTPSPILRRAA